MILKQLRRFLQYDWFPTRVISDNIDTAASAHTPVAINARERTAIFRVIQGLRTQLRVLVALINCKGETIVNSIKCLHNNLP